MTPLVILSAAWYLVASASYGGLILSNAPRREPWLKAGRIAAVIGILLNTAAIGLRCAQTHHTPFTTPAEALSATGWLIALVYTAVEGILRSKAPHAVGALAYPLSFLCVFGGAAMDAHTLRPSATVSTLDTNIISLHVMTILFSFALLVLAVCCSVLYLIQHRLLKQKRVTAGLFSRLPPLNTIDRLAFTFGACAFPLLTVGIVSGGIVGLALSKPLIDANTVMSLLTWAALGGYLGLHSVAYGRGVRANYVLIAGFALALLTYFMQSTLHRFA